ncbi:hypothetical protein [Azospirillum sp.]|uniref:hypothetical protein n=1 Tax=Azospirillum sp. TaxID=34012 RepID=UPI003D70F4A9
MTDVRPVAGVTFCPLDGNAVLFDEARQRVFHLDRLAALIWCHAAEGRGAAEIAERLCRGGVVADRVQGQAWVTDALERWRDLGLTAEDDGGPATAPLRPGVVPGAVEDHAPWPHPIPPPVERRSYALVGTDFSVGFADATARDLLHPLLAHLETDGAPASLIATDVVRAGEGYRLLAQGRVLGGCGAADELAPLVLGEVYNLALRRVPCLLALHAGAVATDAGGLLLSNPMGSGKSTLTAALAACGWRFVCEDIAIIERDSLGVRPFPGCLTLRQGAWSSLAGLLPDLASLPTHRRGGTEAVRYLPPPATGRPARSDKPVPVRWVVFPSHGPEGEPGLVRLDKADGLRTLLANCRAVPAPLDAHAVRRLVAWAHGIEFAALRSRTVEDALGLIAGLTRRGP